MKNLKAICGTVLFTLKKHSPEILMVTGIVGTGVSAVMACRATLKCHEVIERHEEKMDAVLECIEKSRRGRIYRTGRQTRSRYNSHTDRI